MIKLIIIKKAEKIFQTIINILVTQKKRKTICILLTKPVHEIINELKKNKINPENALFITTQENQEKNCLTFNPADLTTLSILIQEAITILPKDALVIFDSFSTLEVYNSPNKLMQFATFLINKMRIRNKDLIILNILQKEETPVYSILKQFTDKIEKK